jgi:hypothetical protein
MKDSLPQRNHQGNTDHAQPDGRETESQLALTEPLPPNLHSEKVQRRHSLIACQRLDQGRPVSRSGVLQRNSLICPELDVRLIV